MKSLKGLLSFLCYFGTGFVFSDQVLEGLLKDSLNINPATQRIIIVLVIVFWIIKIAWFVIDKYLVVKERNLGMDKTKEEIEDLKENHK